MLHFAFVGIFILKTMKDVIEKFKKWKLENPDEDYQYDEIREFLANFTRGELLTFLNNVEEYLNCN